MTQTRTPMSTEIIYGINPVLRQPATPGAPQSVNPWDGLLDQCDDPARRDELQRLAAELESLPAPERHQLADALDTVQLDSKRWLIDELRRCCDRATTSLVVLGGWYGVLPLLFNWVTATPPAHMLSIDIDDHVTKVGRRLVGGLYPNVTFRTADVMALDYTAIPAGTVLINTICEHLPDIEGWWQAIPPGQLVVLQSNDYFLCPDHVSCVRDLAEFKSQLPLSGTLFEGSLKLPIMTRFMLIGRR